MSIKALAMTVLQGNRQGNNRETQSFLTNKPKRPEPLLRKIEVTLPQWQHNFCIAHAMFNNWWRNCSCSIDNCPISRMLESSGNIDKLRGMELGHGITTDMVIDEWLESGEPAADIFKNPTSLICMAELIHDSPNGIRLS